MHCVRVELNEFPQLACHTRTYVIMTVKALECWRVMNAEFKPVLPQKVIWVILSQSARHFTRCGIFPVQTVRLKLHAVCMKAATLYEET